MKKKITVLIASIILAISIHSKCEAFSLSSANSDGDIRWGPSAMTGMIFDFGGRLEFDSVVGIGYGIEFFSDKIWSVGASFLFDFQRGGSNPDKAALNLVPCFFKWINLGVRLELIEGEDAKLSGIMGLGKIF